MSFRTDMVEDWRVVTGLHATEVGDTDGAFIIGLTERERIQAKRYVKDGWEILEAEVIEDFTELSSIEGAEPTYKAVSKQMGSEMMKTLKEFFWGPTEMVFIFFPPIEPDVIKIPTWLVRFACPSSSAKSLISDIPEWLLDT